jgi:heat-inducible transcriptional repressor
MALGNLTARERGVLRALIEHYIATAQPVGSRVLASKCRLGVSAATIRNTLQDLEKTGLVSQPHTSAGRIPTDLGYRQYVDTLLKPEVLSTQQREAIRQELAMEGGNIERILEQTSQVLGYVSKQLGVTIAPCFESGVLSRIDMLPVADNKVLVVLTIRGGLVRSLLLEVESQFSPEAAEATSRALTERLGGLSLGEIRKTIRQRTKEVFEADPKLIKMFLDYSSDMLKDIDPEGVHLGGTTNLVNQPEFRDQEKLSSLMRLIEARKALVELVLSQGIKEGITITIGRETACEEVETISLVTSNYSAGEVKGPIGVIGPTRMPYSKLVSIVDYTAKLLSAVLSGRQRPGEQT